jgi:eukaryotic-like serine/threonine-protein kinase
MKFLSSLFRRKPKAALVDLSERFKLISRLGTGSMSKVWRAQDRKEGTIVALKVLDLEKTQRFESRFVDRVKPSEGEIAVGLLHPHIVHTLEHGRATSGEQFLVMELIEGLGLAYLVDSQNEVLQANRLRIMVELGEAVDYIHKQGWIHRDICPRNVLMDKDYSTKLIDFGLMVPDTPAFHEPGNRTGTANYMAPELIKRQRTDQRIDIFSFAVSCFEMYCKELPWPSLTGVSLEMLLKRINQKPRDIHELVPDIDEQVASAIMKGLAVDPRDRWDSISAMLTPLREARRRLTPPEIAQAQSGVKRRRRDPFADKWQFKTE